LIVTFSDELEVTIARRRRDRSHVAQHRRAVWRQNRFAAGQPDKSFFMYFAKHA
jgi:hypothetical protein